MKRKTLFVALVLVGTFAVTLPAEAGGGARWGFHFGGGSHGGYVRFGYRNSHHNRGGRHHYRRGHRYRRGYRHSHHRHVHVRYPVYRREWVAPVYETVFVGYDGYGRPVYDEVCVTRGYYQRVVVHYSCRTCGVVLH